MNKKIVSISLGAGLAVGSVAGLIAVPSLSGARKRRQFLNSGDRSCKSPRPGGAHG